MNIATIAEWAGAGMGGIILFLLGAAFGQASTKWDQPRPLSVRDTTGSTINDDSDEELVSMSRRKVKR